MLVYLLSYLLNYLLTYLPTYLFTYLLSCLLTYSLTHSLTHSPTHSLTPWSRVLLEKLTGFAANQEIPRILWNNPKVHYRTHKRDLVESPDVQKVAVTVCYLPVSHWNL